jgi:hypothetical protein
MTDACIHSLHRRQPLKPWCWWSKSVTQFLLTAGSYTSTIVNKPDLHKWDYGNGSKVLSCLRWNRSTNGGRYVLVKHWPCEFVRFNVAWRWRRLKSLLVRKMLIWRDAHSTDAINLVHGNITLEPSSLCLEIMSSHAYVPKFKTPHGRILG